MGMRKKIAGFVLAVTLMAGAGPMVGTAVANTGGGGGGGSTDPVLCFVAAQAIITEALHEYREGHLTGAELRSVLKGASVFLGDCLTPS
jgi:hypothetical protein